MKFKENYLFSRIENERRTYCEFDCVEQRTYKCILLYVLIKVKVNIFLQ